MGTTVIVVQHGEKERVPGDSGLTAVGRTQASVAAEVLRQRSGRAVVSSPMLRAQETAAIVANALALPVTEDARLRERMNWTDPEAQTMDEFLVEWRHASSDRDSVPSSGDSSRAAGDRFIEAITELARRHHDRTGAVVAHGGVTTDALRIILGDDRLAQLAPTLIDDGVPCCALTTLTWNEHRWDAPEIAGTVKRPRFDAASF